MTDIQKEILIEKMINCPTDLTDEELMLILSDEELKDIYETSRILKTSLAKPPETDPRKEWELYRPRIARRPNMFGWIARIAAVFFAVVLIGKIVGYSIDWLLTRDATMTDTIAMTTIPSHDQANSQSSETAVPVFQNEIPTESIRKQDATEVPKRNNPKKRKAASTQEENPDTSSEIVSDAEIEEYLKLQQARIDNEIAMIMAEIYLNEYMLMNPTSANPDNIDNFTENPSPSSAINIITNL